VEVNVTSKPEDRERGNTIVGANNIRWHSSSKITP
jgi:hypothetical protein